MLFDKNQTAFPSELHKAIWDCGIHILPVEMTLPQEVADFLGPEMAESCGQLREFMLLVLGDLYENTALYLPISDNRRLGIQYRFFRPLIDFALFGDTEFIRYKPKNGYGSENDKGITFKDRLQMMGRAGLKVEYRSDRVVLTNGLFPSMFPSIRAMAQAITARKEKVSGDNSFMNCDFRVLCPSYKYDKFENALVFLSDGQREAALALDRAARKHKLSRSIKSGICAGYEAIYKHRKNRIMCLGCLGNQIALHLWIPYERDNMAPLEAFFRALKDKSPALLKYFSRRIRRCRNCKGESSADCAVPVSICGSPNKLCGNWWGALTWESCVAMEDVPYIVKILDAITLCI